MFCHFVNSKLIKGCCMAYQKLFIKFQCFSVAVDAMMHLSLSDVYDESGCQMRVLYIKVMSIC